jgi:hypothetical protein
MEYLVRSIKDTLPEDKSNPDPDIDIIAETDCPCDAVGCTYYFANVRMPLSEANGLRVGDFLVVTVKKLSRWHRLRQMIASRKPVCSAPTT